MHNVLHWLPLRQRIEFRVAVSVWYSLLDQASSDLVDLCSSSIRKLSAWITRHLRSASFVSHLHVSPPCKGPSPWLALVWNGLPLSLSIRLIVISQKFLQQLKTTLFGRVGVGSASE